MNRAPTAEDVANNPDLAGLAAIAHEEDDPEGMCRHGNSDPRGREGEWRSGCCAVSAWLQYKIPYKIP